MTLVKRTNNRNTLTPIAELETFGQFPTTFSEIMDDFFGQSFNARRSNGWWRPEMNVSELSDQFEITLALPGINREDVTINLEDNTLVITGERRWREESDRKPHLVESRFGKFRRTLPLPRADPAGSPPRSRRGPARGAADSATGPRPLSAYRRRGDPALAL